jgi:hypothetical protein
MKVRNGFSVFGVPNTLPWRGIHHSKGIFEWLRPGGHVAAMGGQRPKEDSEQVRPNRSA